jgi:hypothetical protein
MEKLVQREVNQILIFVFSFLLNGSVFLKTKNCFNSKQVSNDFSNCKDSEKP